MTATAIRKRLIIYLADADEKKVKAIYSLFEDDIKKEEAFKLTDAHIKILDQRKSRHLSGKDKSYNWEEVNDRIRKKRK
jgi:hypothetical protein